MATSKSFVFFTEVVLCCLVVSNIDTMTGASSESCSNVAWNETFWDKVYYVLHDKGPTAYEYSDVANTCTALGIERLVVDSLAENDFIVETVKNYAPGMESKVFLACPSDGVTRTPSRRFDCRMSKALYEEESHSSKGFWNWRGGKPETDPGGCVLLNTVDGAWSVSDCGKNSNFIICQCRRGIPPGTFVSTRFLERSFGSRNCLNADLIMSVVPVDNFIQCAVECQSDGNCASFNMRYQEGFTSQITCHLSLYHSSIVKESSFSRTENCKYYERMRL